MKFSWNWLADFVDLDQVDPFAVAERFTLTVAELEGVEKTGEGLEGVLVGRIASVTPHRDADHLFVVDVEVGGDTVRCVSGAPNLRPGMLVPTALPGCSLPGGLDVSAVEIRGISSGAVLLSERELGLSDDHSGVMELLADCTPGARLVDALPVRDVVFEVDNKSITHRPDLWGHLGIARELSAMLGRPLAPPSPDFPQGDVAALEVTVDDAADCPRYMAMCYSGVRVAQSPFWLAQRLRAVGMRSINNVVDVTNAVMLGLGEPVHAFDRRRIKGDAIRVRRASPGEMFTTLDGVEHELTPEDLLIADAERGIALAGVMGGENSEISGDTTDVVLECATFHPSLVRRTSVRHGLRTESSARFEKSLDPMLPPMAMAMFTRLLAELSPGAHPSSKACDVASFDGKPVVIDLSPEYVSKRLGMPVEPGRTREILERLGFGVREQRGVFQVTVPSFRATRDVSIPEDLVEEVGRSLDYNRIPPVPPRAPVVLVHRRPLGALSRRIKHFLSMACGLDEVMTYSFDSRNLLDRIGFTPKNPAVLENALSADMTSLRVELAPNLLGVIERNSRNFDEFGVYEIGRVFGGGHDDDGIPVQHHRVGIALYDRKARDPAETTVLARRLKGMIDAMMSDIEAPAPSMDEGSPADRPWKHPRRTIGIESGARKVGYSCIVHPAVMASLDLAGSAAVAEMDLQALVDLAGSEPRKFEQVPRFPSIRADVSLVVDDGTRAGDLAGLIKKNAGPYLVELELVDVYQGSPIPPGKKSLSFSMTFQSRERTLEDREVKDAMDKVVAAARAAGATLRDS